jgi:putative ABC transport system permease protein
MNLLHITWNYIKQRKGNTALNISLLALGTGTMVFLLLIYKQLEANLNNNIKQIDLVVGAKGSPLQLILSSIYHLDIPTGNVLLKDVQKLAKNKYFVKKSIPLALGDSHKGFRIVGTTLQYPQNYQATLQKGAWFYQTFDVVLGEKVAKSLQLTVGNTFKGSHGLNEDAEDKHQEHLYKVVGILNKNNTVLDKLVLTKLESVWKMHQHTADSLQEVTALLIQYQSPMANLQMPRLVNEQTKMQAASPAFELARLLNLVGVSVQILQIFGYILVVMAILSIFIALYNALKERQYDLALMRVLGASKQKLFSLVILEGLLLAGLGMLLGLILGHLTLELLGNAGSNNLQLELTGFTWFYQEGFIVLVALLAGVFASIIPAMQVYKVDIAKTLSQ